MNTVPTSYPSAAAQKRDLETVGRRYSDLRSAIGRTILRLRNDGDLSPEVAHRLYWDLPMHVHNWKPAHSEMYAAYCPEEVETAEGLRDRREAIKAVPVVKKAPKAKPAVSYYGADSEGARLTCQICGRPILANTGVIAHHGYTRDGYGYQSMSCDGALELPFEADKSVLEVEIRLHPMRVEILTKELEEAKAKLEATPAPSERGVRPPNYREMFDAHRDAQRLVWSLEGRIRANELWLESAQKRVAGWKQTLYWSPSDPRGWEMVDGVDWVVDAFRPL